MALDGQLLAETEVTTRWSNGYPMGSADGHPLRISRSWRWKKPFPGGSALRILQNSRLEQERKSDSWKLIALLKRRYRRRRMEPSLHRAFH